MTGTLSPADAAYWWGFTRGRFNRRVLSPHHPTPFHDCTEWALGPTFSDGYRDGWRAEPVQNERNDR